jgi:hypothetical protein
MTRRTFLTPPRLTHRPSPILHRTLTRRVDQDPMILLIYLQPTPQSLQLMVSLWITFRWTRRLHAEDARSQAVLQEPWSVIRAMSKFSMARALVHQTVMAAFRELLIWLTPSFRMQLIMWTTVSLSVILSKAVVSVSLPSWAFTKMRSHSLCQSLLR